MDEVGIILLTLFLFLLIGGPMICLTYSRVKDHRKYHPGTSQFNHARRKLETVSERTTVGREKLDLESGLNQHDSGPECPICIGPLFVPSDGNATGGRGGRPLQAIPSQASGPGTGGGDGLLEGSGGQTRNGGGIGRVKQKLAAANRWRVMHLWTERETTDEPLADDILTLNNCRHAFHARCLSSWFLIERYDCPVCRSPYWQTREERARAASAPPGPARGDGNGAGTEVARPGQARLAVERMSVPMI